MLVYLLDDEQIEHIHQLNKGSNTLAIVCDHGAGPCVSVASLEDPVFAAHKDLIESFKIEPVEIQLPLEMEVEDLRAEVAMLRQEVTEEKAAREQAQAELTQLRAMRT